MIRIALECIGLLICWAVAGGTWGVSIVGSFLIGGV